MRVRNPSKFIILSMILSTGFLSLVSAASPDNKLSQEMILYYFDLVVSGNNESAAGLWEPSSLARATRLGIEYDNIAVKADCNSPIIYDFDRMKSFIQRGVHSIATIDTQVIRWKFKADLDEENISHFYFTARVGKYFWLITPQDYYARDWPIEESKYFRFYINPKKESFYNDIAAQSLDNFIERAAEKILISPERLELMKEMKIDYYLCNTSHEVALLSGINKKGVYDPASDAVITSFMPHYHEVALLLINFKLQKLPRFTLPFIREGLANLLGGRWQRSPGVVFDFGAYILKYGVLEIDSILSRVDFDRDGDITYPVSACLIEYLWTKMGYERFFELYRVLSGNFGFINAIQADEIKTKISEAFGQNWEEFKSDFTAYASGDGARRGLINPGEIKTDRVLISESGLTISASERWLKIEYQAEKNVEPDISFMFDRLSAMKDKVSILFLEQYRDDTNYTGYRYGIRLDKNEIGLYDYAGNLIKAKYVDDFDSNTGYYDDSKNRITAYFDINLLEGALPDKNDYMIIK